MSLRQAFEKLFPVPEGVVWEDGEYHPMQCGHEYTYSENCKRSNATNKGWGHFQAGHAVGLEDAAVCAWSWLMDNARKGGVTPAIDTRFGVCDAIRAMTP